MDTLKGFFVAAGHDDGDPVSGHYYETASPDPGRPQAWGYTDALCYAPGDTLRLHAIATAREAQVTIAQDAIAPRTVWEGAVATTHAPTPADASVRGCGWPEVLRLVLPEDWPSGVYTLSLTVPGHRSEHLFVLRASRPAARILMLLCTGTWCAYNDWGGSNHYQGIIGPEGRDYAPDVSLHRPWARGFVRWPEGAPRIPHASPLLTPPRYPHMEYARARGISKKYASSGWAAFERPFALWCEAQGIALDFTTQHALHRDPCALDGYDRVVIVGHDEYWTWEMRDHLEAWIDAGGELCRFAGNFFWQTRLSPDLVTQTCYKYRAAAEDPAAGTDRLTSFWDHPETRRPAAATMGLTGAAGVYAGWSRCAAHGAGGFVIYRPEHWAMRGTGLGYGDVLGAGAKIFAYEVDGIAYTMTDGLPFAVEGAGLAGPLEIVGLSPATAIAHETGPQDADPFIGALDGEALAEVIHGGVTPETLSLVARGNGCMAEYRRGKGAVFNAGSCEWVAGLIKGEAAVERVTLNVLTGRWGGAGGKGLEQDEMK